MTAAAAAAARVRARVGGGGESGSSQRGGTRCARACGCCADVRPPADGGATEDAARLRGAALRDAARGADGARFGGVCGVRPRRAHRQIAARCARARAAAQPLLDRATAELQAVFAVRAYRGTESFNGFTGNLIRVAEAATPDAGGGGRAARRLGVRLELAGGARERVRRPRGADARDDSYVNCLDWIFVDKAAFRVRAAATLTPLEAMQRHTALPSREFPSDHVWLACDVEWK